MKYLIESHDRDTRVKKLREAADVIHEGALKGFEDKSCGSRFLRSSDLKFQVDLAHELELVACMLEDAKPNG